MGSICQPLASLLGGYVTEAKVDAATVRKVAQLANLEFDENEIDQVTLDLGSMIAHMAKIAELDLSGVAPTFTVFDERGPWRDDSVKASLGQAQALLNAPDKESGHFLVPKVIQTKRS